MSESIIHKDTTQIRSWQLFTSTIPQDDGSNKYSVGIDFFFSYYFDIYIGRRF